MHFFTLAHIFSIQGQRNAHYSGPKRQPMMCRVLSCPFHQKCNWMFTFIYSPDWIHLFKIVSIFLVWIQRILSFIGLKKQPMVQQLSSSHSYHKDHWMITFFYSLADWIHSFTLVNMFSIQRQRISLYVHWAKKNNQNCSRHQVHIYARNAIEYSH